MRALITGSHGTIGTELKNYLLSIGDEVVEWNRDEIAIDNYAVMEKFVRESNVDVVYHLAIASRPTFRENENWLVNYDWPSEISWICRTLNIKFLFVSSVLVFSDLAKGPFTKDSIPDAFQEYGRIKRMAEERVISQNPKTIVARLGWQIGTKIGSNNMLDFFEKEMQSKKEVRASNLWLPACSFISDTVVELVRLVKENCIGIYMLDSNKKWNFFEIASELNRINGNPWKIVPAINFVFDQRMFDANVKIPSLNKKLTGLSK